MSWWRRWWEMLTGRADADLDPRFRVGPERSAGRDRVIGLGGRPGGLSGGVEAELPGNEADPPDPGGRLLLGQCRDGGDQGDSEKAEGEAAHSRPRVNESQRQRFDWGGFVTTPPSSKRMR